MSDHEAEVAKRIHANASDAALREAARGFMRASISAKYSYNFAWQGRPVIQYPQDIVAMQELIWRIRPDLIVETGIAHGGSLVFSASMLALLDMYDAIESGRTFDPRESPRKVVGIDIDIREHNRAALESHPLYSRMELIHGSSTAPAVIGRVCEIAGQYRRVLVCLDSNHTHDHVLGELEAYAPLASKESYCVVFDTVIEELPRRFFMDRPWAPGNSAGTAVAEYIKRNPDFAVDRDIEHKLMITVAPGGFLKRIA